MFAKRIKTSHSMTIWISSGIKPPCKVFVSCPEILKFNQLDLYIFLSVTYHNLHSSFFISIWKFQNISKNISSHNTTTDSSNLLYGLKEDANWQKESLLRKCLADDLFFLEFLHFCATACTCVGSWIAIDLLPGISRWFKAKKCFSKT